MRKLFIFLIAAVLLRCDTSQHERVNDSHKVLVHDIFENSSIPLSETKRTEVIPVETNQYLPIRIEGILTSMSPLLPKINPSLPTSLLAKHSLQLPAEIVEKYQPTTIFIEFENDIFTGTDYYYTNGFTMGVSAPWLSFLKKYKIFPGLGDKAQDRFGVSVTQKMFTGLNPETPEPLPGDHPFAGLLFAELSRVSYSAEKTLWMRSGLCVGVTGPVSLAGNLQRLMHNLEPRGWSFQNANSILLNYNWSIEKILQKSQHWTFMASGMLKAGNLETSSSLNTKVTFNLLPEFGNNAGIQFFASAGGSFVLHKASLRGGLLNHKSAYAVSFDHMNKFVGELSAGVMIQAGHTGMGLKVVSLTSEFRDGLPHKWGSIQLTHQIH